MISQHARRKHDRELVVFALGTSLAKLGRASFGSRRLCNFTDAISDRALVSSRATGGTTRPMSQSLRGEEGDHV